MSFTDIPEGMEATPANFNSRFQELEDSKANLAGGNTLTGDQTLDGLVVNTNEIKAGANYSADQFLNVSRARDGRVLEINRTGGGNTGTAAYKLTSAGDTALFIEVTGATGGGCLLARNQGTGEAVPLRIENLAGNGRAFESWQQTFGIGNRFTDELANGRSRFSITSGDDSLTITGDSGHSLSIAGNSKAENDFDGVALSAGDTVQLKYADGTVEFATVASKDSATTATLYEFGTATPYTAYATVSSAEWCMWGPVSGTELIEIRSFGHEQGIDFLQYGSGIGVGIRKEYGTQAALYIDVRDQATRFFSFLDNDNNETYADFTKTAFDIKNALLRVYDNATAPALIFQTHHGTKKTLVVGTVSNNEGAKLMVGGEASFYAVRVEGHNTTDGSLGVRVRAGTTGLDYALKLEKQDGTALWGFQGDGVMSFPILTTAPTSPSDGDLAFADGTSWNPGSGAGLYERVGGAWSKL